MAPALGKPPSLDCTRAGGIKARGRSHGDTRSQRGWTESPICPCATHSYRAIPRPTGIPCQLHCLFMGGRGSPHFTPTTSHFIPSRLNHLHAGPHGGLSLSLPFFDINHNQFIADDHELKIDHVSGLYTKWHRTHLHTIRMERQC